MHLTMYDQVVLPNSGGSYGGGLAAAQLPMHGLGYGLPLSRLYARFYPLLFHQPISLNSQLSWFIIRYFMGDIKLASVDGYGTDTYIYLQVLSLASKYDMPCSYFEFFAAIIIIYAPSLF